MKVLVLGGNGMIGHHFLTAWQDRHEVKVTLRKDLDSYKKFGLFTKDNSYTNLDVRSTEYLIEIIEKFRPQAVVNATGITKQLAKPGSSEIAIEINALFPHKLARICEFYAARMIQFSTDCIFSGRKGRYLESDPSDADDLYGKSKFLGEVIQPHVVTLRKSTIGLELAGSHGLIEWFLKQDGEIKGFRKAIYSGLITNELVRVVEMILLDFPNLSGIWNIASTPINKYDLLTQLQQRLDLKKAEIIPDDKFICDRSLDGSRFEAATGYKAPDWEMMLKDIALEINKRNDR